MDVVQVMWLDVYSICMHYILPRDCLGFSRSFVRLLGAFFSCYNLPSKYFEEFVNVSSLFISSVWFENDVMHIGE